MDAIFGLDFGTTNSAMSVNINGNVEMVNAYVSGDGKESGRTLKSLLYFDSEEKRPFVGQDAIKQYVNDAAMGRFMRSIKTFLPSTTFDHTYVFGKKYSLDDLIAIILRYMKTTGEKQVGREIPSVVVGRPVVFSEDPEIDKLAEDRLRSATIKAGFTDISFQLEPIAAAYSFEASLKTGEEKLVLICDLGGGTSDFTVIKLKGGEKEKSDRRGDILSLGGVYVGGDIFDSRIMWEKLAKYFGRDVQYKSMNKTWLPFPPSITYQLRHWHLIPLLQERSTLEYIRRITRTADNKQALINLEALIVTNTGLLLFQAIENAKWRLSTEEQADISFSRAGMVISEEITRQEFEDIIREEINKIKECVTKTVRDAGIPEHDIDLVFITGGSSYVPCVQQLFIKMFGSSEIKQGDAFTSVAYGLGLSANFR